jgi:hypothetical protein
MSTSLIRGIQRGKMPLHEEVEFNEKHGWIGVSIGKPTLLSSPVSAPIIGRHMAVAAFSRQLE